VQLRIGPNLMLALAGLLAATVMVSWVAVAGLGAVNARTQRLYRPQHPHHPAPGQARRRRPDCPAAELFRRTGLDPQDEAQEQAMTRQAVAIIDPITTQVAEVAAHEMEHTHESQEEAEATHQATR
jgi:hypothetical protein